MVGLILFAAALLLCACGASEQEKVIVTSFYPMYILTSNVADGVEGVKVTVMADQSAGCLHDYQLQTRDMVALEGASALVINGGGMEQFLDKVAQLRGDLPVIDASAGIDMLCSDDGHDHDHDHDHAHDVLNAHVWLDPKLAIVQVRNIAQGLAQADPEHAQAYYDNADAYAARLEKLDEQIAQMLAPVAGSSIVTFHEAFDYFAAAYQIHVAGVIQQDAGEEPGTREIAQTCDLVREMGVKALFAEPQYPQRAAQTIARETGAQVYLLDPVVSGDGEKDSYERIMLENAKVLTEALNP